jgi:hypothetical protein
LTTAPYLQQSCYTLAMGPELFDLPQNIFVAITLIYVNIKPKVYIQMLLENASSLQYYSYNKNYLIFIHLNGKTEKTAMIQVVRDS